MLVAHNVSLMNMYCYNVWL